MTLNFDTRNSTISSSSTLTSIAQSTSQNSALTGSISGCKVSKTDPKPSLSNKFASFLKKSSKIDENNTSQSLNSKTIISATNTSSWQRFKNIFKSSTSIELSRFKEGINADTVNVKELRSTKIGRSEIDVCAKKMLCEESISFLDAVSEYDQLVEQFTQTSSQEVIEKKLQEIEKKYDNIVKTYIVVEYSMDISNVSKDAVNLELNLPSELKTEFQTENGDPKSFDQHNMSGIFNKSSAVIEKTFALALPMSPHYQQLKSKYNN